MSHRKTAEFIIWRCCIENVAVSFDAGILMIAIANLCGGGMLSP
jgi:hypothetical protein